METIQNIDSVDSFHVIKPSQVVAAIKDDQRRRVGDSMAGVFAENLVTATEAAIDKFEYPESKWLNGGLVPMGTRDNPGAVFSQYREQEQIGEAAIIADNATDIPVADIRGELTVTAYKNIAIGIQVTDQEIRTGNFDTMTNIMGDKVQAAREAHDRTFNGYIFNGVPGHKLIGVNTIAGKIVLAATTGTWSTATAAQMESDLATAVTLQMTASTGINTPNTIVMPLSIYRLVQTTSSSTDKNITVMEYMMKVNPMISRWEWAAECDTASAAGGNALFLYRNEQSRFRLKNSMFLAPIMPERRGQVTQLNYVTRTAGIACPKPRSMLRLDGI